MNVIRVTASCGEMGETVEIEPRDHNLLRFVGLGSLIDQEGVFPYGVVWPKLTEALGDIVADASKCKAVTPYSYERVVNIVDTLLDHRSYQNGIVTISRHRVR